MPVYLLVKRNSVDGAMMQLLGVYTGINTAYTAFRNRYHLNHFPFTGATFFYSDLDALVSYLGATNPNAGNVKLYDNGTIRVNIERSLLDQPVA